MTPLTLVAVAFVLALLLFGFAFWTPIYAIPLAVLFLIGLGAALLSRRRLGDSRELRDFRSQAGRRDQVERSGFTERDEQTLYDGS